MFIDIVSSRNSSLVVLLCKSYQNNGKVEERTLANPSCFDSETIPNQKITQR